MIRRIQQIKAFGVFEDFQWSASLPEFKQLNLIYGWNYSGKTTLSRAFRCFELRQPHMDFADAQIQLKSEDGIVHHLSIPHTAPVFRVFNSDFVRENLSFTDGSAAAILVLGAEDIVKQAALKSKKAERETLELSKQSNVGKRDDQKLDIAGALTNYARDFIKNPLAVPNYDKTRFEPNVQACKNDPDSFLLDDNTFAHWFSVYRSTDKKPALVPKVISLFSVGDAKEKTAALLDRIVTANVPIPWLKWNPVVESWVKEGRSLHHERDTCQFCGQHLPTDLMSHLAGHFSADYESLMAELKTTAELVHNAALEEIALDHKSDFYTELSERFTQEKIQLEGLLGTRKSALVCLESALTAKQTSAFTRLDCPSVDDPAGQISSTIEAINRTIAEHNRRTMEFEAKRLEAFARLEKHYAASFVRDQKYNEALQEIANLRAEIAEQKRKLGELDMEIGALENMLSEAAKGAERINELLIAYFGKDDLRIVLSPDKRFQIVRSGVTAKNLSEGEKTAIAFAYFITRVQDGRHPMADTRIVIDDPISSLDASHLFNTYALIKTQLVGCCQLFVSTHSFEFYSLIRDWVADDEGRDHAKKPQASWKKWSVFYMKRTDDGKSVLEEIPKELLKFKSEYHYLFSTLYRFDKAGAGDFDTLLSLPNVVRRFMEAFGGVMIPLSTGLKSKMDRIFPDEIVRERVWKFINEYSHNTTIMRSLTIPDMSECKSIVQACLKAVQDWNVAYFKDLEEEVT